MRPHDNCAVDLVPPIGASGTDVLVLGAPHPPYRGWPDPISFGHLAGRAVVFGVDDGQYFVVT